MSILKLNSRKLFNVLAVNVENQNVRVRSSAVSKKKSAAPVAMAYASYESTQSSPRDGAVPPLIVMHGLFGSKGNWNSLCKAMHSRSQPQRKIIAVDARNHGDSPHSAQHSYEDLARDIKQLMATQNIRTACLMGHSMGGKAVMYFALRYPELVDRLIVVDISPFSSSPSMIHTYQFFGVMQNVNLEANVPLSTARQQADTTLAQIIRDKGVRAFILTNLVKKDNGSYDWRINIPALKNNYQKIAKFPPIEGLVYQGKTLIIAGGLSDFVHACGRSMLSLLSTKLGKWAVVRWAGVFLSVRENSPLDGGTVSSTSWVLVRFQCTVQPGCCQHAALLAEVPLFLVCYILACSLCLFLVSTRDKRREPVRISQRNDWEAFCEKCNVLEAARQELLYCGRTPKMCWIPCCSLTENFLERMEGLLPS